VAWAARQVQVAQMADSLAVVLVAALVRVVDNMALALVDKMVQLEVVADVSVGLRAEVQAAVGQVLESQFAHALGKVQCPFCYHQSVVIACLTHFDIDLVCPRHLPHSHLDVESAK
jgi:hypothetical protein